MPAGATCACGSKRDLGESILRKPSSLSACRERTMVRVRECEEGRDKKDRVRCPWIGVGRVALIVERQPVNAGSRSGGNCRGTVL